MNQTYFEWYEFDGNVVRYNLYKLQLVFINQRFNEYI